MTRPGRAGEPVEVRTTERRRVATSVPEAPPAVRWIVRTLEEEGFQTWAVGGAVRDALLGLENLDWDLATRARPQDVQRIFRRTVPVGVEHGTVGILARDGTLFEVTTFRRDVETSGRHAVVEFADSVEEDLARRDFTINALAWHPLRGELLDPFGGVEDLEQGVLRAVGRAEERFSEDYLRVLRALRFAGRFGLSVEETTWNALREAVAELHVLSPERVREELTKVLERDRHPSRALALFASSGALAKISPELASLVGGPGAPPESSDDAWSFAARAAEAIPAHRPDLRLAALLMDVGNAHGVAGDLPESNAGPDGGGGVTERAARRAAALLTRLRYSNARIDRVVGLVGAGLEPPPAEASDGDWRRWISRVGPKRLPDLARVWAGRCRAREGVGAAGACDPVVAAWRRARSVLGTRPPLAVGDLALDGRDLIRLGLKPGPRFGTILESLLDRVLEDPGLNTVERLEALVRELTELGGETPDGGGGAAP